MKDVEKRIAALEADNTDLKRRIEALQLLLPGNKSVPPRRDEPQVRITTPPLAKVALPTEDEFHRLLHVVLDCYPVLKPREDPEDYAAQFRAAFIRLQHCGRRDKVDTERGLGWWLDDCAQWCRRHQVNPSWIGGAAFTAAVIAHGDIRYVMDNWPHATAFSIQFAGGGREATGQWKRVLGGALLDAVPPRYPTKSPSPARVQQFAIGWRK